MDRNWKEVEVSQNERKEKIGEQLSKLKKWCVEQAHKILPKSSIGKAVRYYLKQYPKLEMVAATKDIQLDNNLIENKIRPLALGRKNYLFAGNHRSAQRIAMMYSFFATCKAKNINPSEWLISTLEKLADPDYSLKELIP